MSACSLQHAGLLISFISNVLEACFGEQTDQQVREVFHYFGSSGDSFLDEDEFIAISPLLAEDVPGDSLPRDRRGERHGGKAPPRPTAESAVRGADRCGVCCEVTLTVHFIDADDILETSQRAENEVRKLEA